MFSLNGKNTKTKKKIAEEKKLKPGAFGHEKEAHISISSKSGRKQLITSLDSATMAQTSQEIITEKKLIIPVIPSTKSGSDLNGLTEEQAEELKALELKSLQETSYGLNTVKSESSITKTEKLNGRKALSRGKRDIKSMLNDLPDEAEEDYDVVPIEEFGMGALRGMGYDDTKEASEGNASSQKLGFERRPERLGLGATLPDLPELHTKNKKRRN